MFIYIYGIQTEIILKEIIKIMLNMMDDASFNLNNTRLIYLFK